MEAAAALVSFVSLAGPIAKFLYDFTADMKDCPKDIREMKADLEGVEYLITQIIKQSNERDEQLQHNVPLALAIGRAQESVDNLQNQLKSYPMNGKRMRLRFVWRLKQTEKLRATLERTKTVMLEIKSQLDSDVLYEIHDLSQEVLRSVEKTSRRLETYDQNPYNVSHQSGAQADLTDTSSDIVETTVQQTSFASSEGLLDIDTVAIDHVSDLLMETRVSSPSNSMPSTPASSCEVSDIFGTNSSQGTAASSVSSTGSIAHSVSPRVRQPDIVSQHPLLSFKDDLFHFLVAIIFTQCSTNKRLACQCASECLVVYQTPEALSKASPEALSQYFRKIGLYNRKPPQLIEMAEAYVKDPPQRNKLRPKKDCLQSEVSHLPWIGPKAVNTYLVYYCGRTDIETKDKKLLKYMELLKNEPEFSSR